MRKSRILLAGAAVAAAAVATSAFTASNTVPDSVAGYGQGDVTGATVDNIDYVASPTDSTILNAVKFTVTTDITGATSTMVLKSGATPANPNDGTDGTPVGNPYACSITTPWADGELILTCDTTVDGPVTFASFNAVGLTVVN
jgi:hypothetical protein